MAREADEATIILVAVDGSERSRRAYAYAIELAGCQGGARVLCVHVRTIGRTIDPDADVHGRVLDALDSFADDIRHIYSGKYGERVDAEFLESAGAPAAEIIRIANELRVNAVVVGASAKTFRMFPRSIASTLVKRARWPVIVVP